MIELWRGCVNAWECDELGHYNVRFYLARASEALANLAEAAGLNPIQRADALATLIPQTLHIRFLAEARPGAPLYIEGGIVGFATATADIVLVMRHSGTGKPAASFSMRVGHAAPASAEAFPWPKRFATTVEALTVDKPDFAAPRGLATGTGGRRASMSAADALDLPVIGRGRFGPHEMDAFGWMRAEFLLGRVSDSVTNFAAAFPEEWDMHAGEPSARIGSALLECCIHVHRWPRAGEGFVIRSGLKSAGPKVRNIVHWVLEPASGKPWWTMEGVAAPMDLDQRKLAAIDPETQAKLDAAAVPGIEA
ncbi:thioesterase family protein [Maricaulis maris]|uniref:Acyl-CoA thioester hydrolase n=1 Tax=Maricaulis maris TaxID=74318 RepID=A0A495DM22_9PROT|nr:thioesterase family protein [Maricaulis maris]RKR03966.1 acyl-CoA thioester hydrolase [Maricaulis maris]